MRAERNADRGRHQLVGAAGRWWPVPVLLVTIIAIQILVTSQFDARGHADGHLSSASAVYGVIFLVGVTLVAVRGPLWRRASLWLVSGAVVASAVVGAVGNLLVVDAIGGEAWSDTEAARLGPARSGFTLGHDLAGPAGWATVASTVVLAVWLWRNERLSTRATIAAAGITFLMPPWIFPGAGLAVIAAATAIDCERRARLLKAV